MKGSYAVSLHLSFKPYFFSHRRVGKLSDSLFCFMASWDLSQLWIKARISWAGILLLYNPTTRCWLPNDQTISTEYRLQKKQQGVEIVLKVFLRKRLNPSHLRWMADALLSHCSSEVKFYFAPHGHNNQTWKSSRLITLCNYSIITRTLHMWVCVSVLCLCLIEEVV